MKTNIAVFLDRDNTINYDPGYISKPEDVRLLNGVPEGLLKLKKEINALLIVISNQSGVARGYYTENDIRKVNSRINELLENSGSVKIDDFFYCIYHQEFSSAHEAECRKPSPKMIFEAAKKYNISVNSSYLIGDSVSDVQCGNNAGTKSIFLVYDERDSKMKEVNKLNLKVEFIAHDFLEACEFIINDYKRKIN